jgi:hypothetical protein
MPVPIAPKAVPMMPVVRPAFATPLLAYSIVFLRQIMFKDVHLFDGYNFTTE